MGNQSHGFVIGSLCCFALLAALACSREESAPAEPATRRPSILLLSLDTTRADRLEGETGERATPELADLAARGMRFIQAYSTAPVTLPSHLSMLTGLYPAEHRVRENGRHVGAELDLLAPLLREMGYRTAAFVSGYPLAGEFGLARGFDHYDDDFAGTAERDASQTTQRALAYLEGGGHGPLFLWVHYFDPHDPYEPPQPFLSQHASDPYLGEIAFMDHELGRLIDAFERRFEREGWKIIVVGDHGESLGEHGETLHGNLLYQGVMRVPLILAGSGIPVGEVESPVSVRRLFDTILHWAGHERDVTLLSTTSEPVLGEALKPYLQYGWQPQFMAVGERYKVIRSGETEIYDIRSDPLESRNLVGEVELDPHLRQAVSAYATRALADPDLGDDASSQQAREQLASLGYVTSSAPPTLAEDAPNPKDMAHLFHDLDVGAALFVRRDYEQAIQVYTRLHQLDPGNLMVTLHLAVAHSVLGDEERAMEYFERARGIDPGSIDLRHYRAMHHLRRQEWDSARPLFESVLAQMPDRLPALEGLAQVYTRQGRVEDAARLLEKIVEIKDSPGLELARLGELRMAGGETVGAIRAFEKARDILADEFTYNLELGVLYLANRQLAEAAASLDKVSNSHPGYPMALFKRAQVSVLLAESDREERVRRAWAQADETTRQLIENEQLFREISFR